MNETKVYVIELVSANNPDYWGICSNSKGRACVYKKMSGARTMMKYLEMRTEKFITHYKSLGIEFFPPTYRIVEFTRTNVVV